MDHLHAWYRESMMGAGRQDGMGIRISQDRKAKRPARKDCAIGAVLCTSIGIEGIWMDGPSARRRYQAHRKHDDVIVSTLQTFV